MNDTKKSVPFFKYKGKPLVRCGNILYYGSMNDPYVVKIESLETKKVLNLDVSTLVNVEMIDTSIDNENSKKIVKISQKNGLYPALDIANIWLERALSEQNVKL